MRDGNDVPRDEVARMFDEIAPVYDRLNTLMTLGLDRGWRRAAVSSARIGQGDAVADIACGTGKLTGGLAEAVGPFGRVIGVDLSDGMLARARAEYGDVVQVELRQGDALALPIEDGGVDAATIAFGLRNLPDFESAFREMRRIVRPGGIVVCLELTMPRPRLWGRVFHATFRRVAPLAGSAYGKKDAYQYLPESLKGFPDADLLAATMRAAGLADVAYRRLGLGMVALHHGRVPD